MGEIIKTWENVVYMVLVLTAYYISIFKVSFLYFILVFSPNVWLYWFYIYIILKIEKEAEKK